MTQLLMDLVPHLPQLAKPGKGLLIYLHPLFCFLGLVSRDVLTEHSRKLVLVWERDLKQQELSGKHWLAVDPWLHLHVLHRAPAGRLLPRCWLLPRRRRVTGRRRLPRRRRRRLLPALQRPRHHQLQHSHDGREREMQEMKRKKEGMHGLHG